MGFWNPKAEAGAHKESVSLVLLATPIMNVATQQYKKDKYKIHSQIITDSVVLWKIQKFDWLIPETK